MLYVGITKARDIFENYSALLSFGEKTKFKSIKNKKEAEMYATAKILLRIMMKEFLNKDFKELEYNSHGKPYLKNFPYDFNISHSEGVCVVLLSDIKNEKVGIDVQKNLTDEKKTERIAKRFFKNIDEKIMENSYISTEFFIYDLKDGHAEKNKIFLKPKVQEDFNFKWTRLEAFLKARGTGFCQLEEAPEIKDKFSSFEYEDYTISICKKEL